MTSFAALSGALACRTSRHPSPPVAAAPVEVVDRPELASSSGGRRGGDLRDGSVDDADEPGLVWPVTAEGWTEAIVGLESASHEAPEGAPVAVVHAPPGFDASPPLQLVVFLHGWSGCAVVLEASGEVPCRPGDGRPRHGWGLGARHDEAGTNTLLIVPQLAYLRRDGAPGRFGEAGGFRRFLEELLSEALAERLGGPRSVDQVERIVLVSHSAGFETALAILQRGDVEELVRDVILFDSLYAGPAIFAQWAAGGGSAQRRIVSLHTGAGMTLRFSEMLGQYMTGHLGAAQVAVDPRGGLGAAIEGHRAVIARTSAPHGLVPARHLSEVLSSLGLRRRVMSRDN